MFISPLLSGFSFSKKIEVRRANHLTLRDADDYFAYNGGMEDTAKHTSSVKFHISFSNCSAIHDILTSTRTNEGSHIMVKSIAIFGILIRFDRCGASTWLELGNSNTTPPQLSRLDMDVHMVLLSSCKLSQYPMKQVVRQIEAP